MLQSILIVLLIQLSLLTEVKAQGNSTSWKNEHKTLRGTDRPDSIAYYIPYENGDFVFSRVVEVQGDKSDIFSRAMIALPKALAVKNNIKGDNASGVVVSDGFINVPKTGELHKTAVTISMECRDGRYRIKIYNVGAEKAKTKGGYVWLYEKIVLKDEYVGEKKRRKKDLVQLYDAINRLMDSIQLDMQLSDF